MIKIVLAALISFNVLFSNGSSNFIPELNKTVPKANTGTLEKMIAANGSVAMDIDLNRINGKSPRAKESKTTRLSFDVQQDSFFTALVFNNELRAFLPSTMAVIPTSYANLPAKLNASYQQLVIENLPHGEPFDLAIRDGKTGFVFFNIEGEQSNYTSDNRLLSIQTGRMLLSKDFAVELGRPSDAGAVVGELSINATMRAIEVTQYDDGEIKSDVLPAVPNPNAGTVPGPDVIVGDLTNLQQFGASGTQVGLAVGSDSCNLGTVDLNWFQLPVNDHPVIPQNLYRMSGGPTNDERFEQIGQSHLKHAFAALTGNLCNLGCQNPGTQTRLGSGCSDPYSSSLNSGPNLGSRAWINPFTGAYPRGDSATPPNSHTGHTHTGSSHRILTEISDLTPSLNPGATYYAEAQYVTPHEYAWCQSNPGQCNMNNNVSYRRYNVTTAGSPFSFSAAAPTVRVKPAIAAWTGSLSVEFAPDPANDGIGTIAYKVTNTSPGVWHYEYAIYNQNLDRAIQSFSVPIGGGIALNNIGFHAPPQHPGWAADGTVGSAGYSSTPWSSTLAFSALTWSTETFAQNPNANAIRWGTMYNFRFDSNRPPENVNATIRFFKTGNPIFVKVMVPSCEAPYRCSGVRDEPETK